MTWADWLPAATLGAILGWLSRLLIETRLNASVRHEFDVKIETLRAEFRKSEAQVAAELRSRDALIDTLRSSAISGLASRQANLDKRRIEAVDQLWSATVALAPAKSIAVLMKGVKFDVAVEHASRNPKIREMFEFLGQSFSSGPMQATDAFKARPFVSPLAWALFYAYLSVVALAVAKFQMLKSGLNWPDVLNNEGVANLVKVALPHQEGFLGQHGTDATLFLLDELESRLLDELQKSLLGGDSDRASLNQAAAILKEAERLLAALPQAAGGSGS
jgi:hypothetical protein